MRQPARRYFRCAGCMGIAGVLLESSEAGPAGSVFHMKPPQDANRRVVQCKLFQSLSPEAFAELHKEAPELEELAGGTWEKCVHPASTSYIASWLASQFQRPEQLSAYLQLSIEERIACFPPVSEHLSVLDEEQWRTIGNEALESLKGVSN